MPTAAGLRRFLEDFYNPVESNIDARSILNHRQRRFSVIVGYIERGTRINKQAHHACPAMRCCRHKRCEAGRIVCLFIQHRAMSMRRVRT